MPGGNNHHRKAACLALEDILSPIAPVRWEAVLAMVNYATAEVNFLAALLNLLTVTVQLEIEQRRERRYYWRSKALQGVG